MIAKCELHCMFMLAFQFMKTDTIPNKITTQIHHIDLIVKGFNI